MAQQGGAQATTFMVSPNWRFLMVVVILFSVSTAMAFSQGPIGKLSGPETASREVEALAQEAERDFTKGDYFSAARKYERLVALEPESAGALNNLGISYHMAGELRQAVPVLKRALRLDPDLVPANLILGIDYVQLNEAGQAVPHLERVLQRDGTNRDALLALASAHLALKRFDQAARAYQREVKIRPDDADAWYGLGLCFENLAEETTREMTRAGKDSPYTQRLIGEFLTEQDSALDAQDAFRRALAAGGPQEGLHAALGFADLRFGDITQAEQEFRAEVQIHPKNLDGKLGMAALAMERDDLEAAQMALCEVYTTDERFFEVRVNFFLASLPSQTELSVVNNFKSDNSPGRCAPALDLVRQEVTSPQSFVQSKDTFETAGVTKAPTAAASPSRVAAARAANETGRYSACFEGPSRQLHRQQRRHASAGPLRLPLRPLFRRQRSCPVRVGRGAAKLGGLLLASRGNPQACSGGVSTCDKLGPEFLARPPPAWRRLSSAQTMGPGDFPLSGSRQAQACESRPFPGSGRGLLANGSEP